MFHVQFRNQPEDETVAVSRIFLGTQLQCARCHDHPYEPWTQKDFYGMAGFFVRTTILQGAPHYWGSDPIDEPNSFSGFLAPRLMRFLAEKL